MLGMQTMWPKAKCKESIINHQWYANDIGDATVMQPVERTPLSSRDVTSIMRFKMEFACTPCDKVGFSPNTPFSQRYADC